METMENNIPSATHQEKAKKMKKLRRWQIAVSLLGVAIIVWGVIEVICLFLNYSRTETSNDAQIEQYVSPINLRASGYIDKIYFTEHQEVRKGDTLLVLDDREYKIRVMEAEAALKDAQAGATVINATLNTTQTTATVYDASIAEIEVRLAKLEKDRKRYENLVERKAATPIQLEQIVTDYEATRKKLEAVKRQKKAALSGVDEVSYRRVSTEAAIQRATAALEMARLNLSYTVVKSPADGVVGTLPYRVGALVSSALAQPLTTVSDNSDMYVYFSMTENQLLGLIRQYGSKEEALKNMPAIDLQLNDKSAYSERGQIESISGVIDRSTGTVSLRAVFPNKEGLLHSGGAGNVIVPVQKTAALTIPQAATFEIQDKRYVYKVVDGKAQSSQVQVTRVNGGREFIVDEGLVSGDVIVTEGVGLLREGTPIKAKTAQAATTTTEN